MMVVPAASTPLSDERVSESLRCALQAQCRGALLDVGAYSCDFGGIIRRVPRLAFAPSSLEDLAAALRLAVEHGVPITARGAAHSQSGQSLGEGLVLDLRGLGGPPIIDGERLEIGAGYSWRAATDFSFAEGFVPRALTHMLDATIGGTLSVGGIGSESWRWGPQVDNVCWLDVMTVDGNLVRCSPTVQPELFDAVRAGLGQCGIMVRVGYPLRRSSPLLRTRSFFYRDAAAFHADVGQLSSQVDRDHFLAAAIVRDPQEPSARGLLLCVGKDLEERSVLEGDDLPELHADRELPARHAPLWQSDGMPGHIYFQTFPRRYPDVSDGLLHPWVDHFLSSEATPGALESLRSGRHRALNHGTLGLIFVRRGPVRAPLFVLPEPDGLNCDVGMFSAFLPTAREDGLAKMRELIELVRPYGGKRYLSSHRPFDWLPCAEHYGAVWDQFVGAKQRFDPRGSLNPGFIDWPSTPGPTVMA